MTKRECGNKCEWWKDSLEGFCTFFGGFIHSYDFDNGSNKPRWCKEDEIKRWDKEKKARSRGGKRC